MPQRLCHDRQMLAGHREPAKYAVLVASPRTLMILCCAACGAAASDGGAESTTTVAESGDTSVDDALPAGCAAQISPFLESDCLVGLASACQAHALEPECAAAPPFSFDGYSVRCRWIEVVTIADVASCTVESVAYSGTIWAPVPAALGQSFRTDLGTDSGALGHRFRRTWAPIPEHLGGLTA